MNVRFSRLGLRVFDLFAITVGGTITHEHVAHAYVGRIAHQQFETGFIMQHATLALSNQTRYVTAPFWTFAATLDALMRRRGKEARELDSGVATVLWAVSSSSSLLPASLVTAWRAADVDDDDESAELWGVCSPRRIRESCRSACSRMVLS